MSVATRCVHGIYGVMDFADKLGLLIELRGTSQTQLAKDTGIKQSEISKMTSRRRRPYLDQAFILARHLGVTIEYLANEEIGDVQATVPIGMTEAELKIWKIIRDFGADGVLLRLLEVGMNRELQLPHQIPAGIDEAAMITNTKETRPK
jgi:transcriptional regulator with XRE-family HTH domain